jgi:transposase
MSSYKENREKYFDEVIRLWFEEGVSLNGISKIIPVSEATVDRWIAKFASENSISRSHNALMGKVKTKTERAIAQLRLEAEIKQLKAEKARLESDLRRAEIKADLYNEMIDVAEKMFDIPIRKKVGAKR